MYNYNFLNNIERKKNPLTANKKKEGLGAL